MRTKEDFVKLLRNDPMYKSALKTAKTPEERKKIIQITEAFVEQYASILAPIISQVESDPKLKEQLRQSLDQSDDLLSDAGSEKTPDSQG